MCREVEERQIVHIRSFHTIGQGNDNSTQKYSKNINISFDPDEVILKYIIYTNPGGVSSPLIQVYSNKFGIIGAFPTTVGNVVLDSIDDPSSHFLGSTIIKCDNHFECKGVNVNGRWEFILLAISDLTSDNVNNTLAGLYGTVCLCLEFVRYARK